MKRLVIVSGRYFLEVLRDDALRAKGLLELKDDQTGDEFLLVRREWHDRVQSILRHLDEEYDPDEGFGSVNETMAADDENDPLLEGYQKMRQSP